MGANMIEMIKKNQVVVSHSAVETQRRMVRYLGVKDPTRVLLG
jgi:hypothetical protein